MDTYFGTVVDDPYRWLEDGTSPAVLTWQTKQNLQTRAFLGAIPGREHLRHEIDQLLRMGVLDQPAVAGSRIFYEYRPPGSQQRVLRVVNNRVERTLIDPNDLSQEGSVAVDWWYPSTTGKYAAVGLSKNGSEQSVLHVLRVPDGFDMGEAIDRTQAATVAWVAGDRAFYYSRFNPGGVAAQAGRRIYLHTLGKRLNGNGDPLVYGARNAAADWPFVAGSANGSWFLLGEPHGSSVISPITFELLNATKPDATPRPLISEPVAWFSTDFGLDNLFALTDRGAPNRRVYSIALRNSDPSYWKVVIPEGPDLLDSVTFAGSSLVGSYLHNVHSELRLFSLGGSPRGTIPIPGIGNALCCAYDANSNSVFYTYTSFNMPTQIFQYSMVEKRTSVWRSVKAPFDLSGVKVEQVVFKSKDGTQIPMFIVQEKGAHWGPRPLLLMGYGGFGLSLLPSFSTTGIEFVRHGGIYAVPNIRGGGEFGSRWHEAGMLLNKQNTFDDFEAAAQWLIDHRYTALGKLAIIGASNGGLLTAAEETQHPQLFRAIVSISPLTDMLRFQNFGAGSVFASEYGTSGNEAQFRYLVKYSPYHNIHQGTPYPATLVEVAENDPRVDPMHGRKFVARLQDSSTSGEHILLRVASTGGHGYGESTSALVDQTADTLAFLFKELGMASDASTKPM